MKAIIAIQIIFWCFTTFFYFISYNNEIRFNSALGSRFEWLSNKEEKKNSTDNYDVKKLYYGYRKLLSNKFGYIIGYKFFMYGT